jgi:hypothetical protein
LPVLLVEPRAQSEAPPPAGSPQVVSSTPRLALLARRPAIFLPVLTLLALLIHGYHPYVDDAAIYVAGIEKVVHPTLFPLHAEYVLPHLRHSLFSFALGWLIRVTHVPLRYALFLTYLASVWLMLLAGWRLTCALFTRHQSRMGAMLLLTAALTLPVAGSAIFFMDPYLTARSFSTPATLFAIAFALERKMLLSTLCLVAAFVLHPLMAAYAVGFVVALVLVRRRSWTALAALAVAVLAAGWPLSHASILLGSSASYHQAALSRSYFFLNRWAWFEVFGLFPPLAAALLFCGRRAFAFQCNFSRVAGASIYVGALSIVFAALFARTSDSFLLARLQPLRVFQIIYIVFFLLLGSVLADYVLRRRWWAWAACFALVAGIMFTAQIYIYPSLPHIEWPWAQPRNPWEQAFLWIRHNTPNDALFALDPHYQRQPQEDTLGFRAMTQRSVLADWSKDGGVAAIYPAVAPEWWNEVTTTRDFSHWTDSQRIHILAPYGVNWVVLAAASATRLPCPYQNSVVRVCRLPAEVALLQTHP